MAYPETFLEVIKKYNVVIPIIQRDYVQGMDDNIINELLDDIKNAFVNKEILRLNFIYGKIEDDLFIPLDGQQRLTTLFLLHIFAFRDMPEKDDSLSKFSYETRRSSREFFQRLCDAEKRKVVLSGADKPSDKIKKSLWFHVRWGYDPTIKSALNCLDLIYEKFSEIKDIAELLESKEQKYVLFNFIPMTDMGMEDSLYIKLNARGRALTNFETYKAELLAKIEHCTLHFTSDEFAINLDTVWSDYFWGIGNDAFDKAYRYCFSFIFERMDSSTSRFVESVSQETITEAFYTLNYIAQNNNHITEYFKKCISSKVLASRTLTYPERLIVNALTFFLGKARGSVNQSELNDWYRIITNLTVNTTIDRAETYISAYGAIKSLGLHCFKLLDYFSTSAKLILGGFSPEQIREERVKAKLIKLNYQKEILDAESHKYFSGQIRSALNIANLTLENIDSYDTADVAACMAVFTTTWKKIESLFGETAPNCGYLLRAALLSCGDYMPTNGQYISLCVDRAEEPTSLKTLFTSGHDSTVKLISALKNADEVELQSLVDSYIANGAITDWQYWMIKHPGEMMKYLSSSSMRLCKSSHSYLLVSKHASSSHCKEIYTFALSMELKKANKPCQLSNEYGRDADYRLISGGKTVRYKDGKFEVEDSSGTKSYASDILAAIQAL